MECVLALYKQSVYLKTAHIINCYTLRPMKTATILFITLIYCTSISLGQSNNSYSNQYQSPIVSSLSSISQLNNTTQSQSTTKTNNGNGNSGAGYGNGGPYESTYGSSTNGNNGNGQGQGNPNGYQDVPNGPYNNNNTSNPQHPAHPCNPNNKNFPNDGCQVQAPNVPINDHIGLLMLAGAAVAMWMMYKSKIKVNSIDAI